MSRKVSQQIGWSEESKLYYYVLNQIEQLIGIYGAQITTTTTSSTTTIPPNPSVRVNPPSVNTFDIPEYIGFSGADFTIEWLQYMHTNLDFPRLYSVGQYPAQNAVSIEGGVLYLWFNGGIQGSYNLSSLPGGYLDIWIHIVVTRFKGDVHVWANGVEIITILNYSNAIPTNGLDLYIGSENVPNTYYNGLISNFRWTTGAASYNDNSPSYPTNPLPTVPETILLVCQGSDLTSQLTDVTGTNTITATGCTYNIDSGISGWPGSLQFGTI